MLRNFLRLCLLTMMLGAGISCTDIVGDFGPDTVVENSYSHGSYEATLDSSNFKVPVASGYNWEITQSWSEHCSICNSKGYDETYGDYCDVSTSSHMSDCCKYGWDFSLAGAIDKGKPVLASADGVVKKLDANASGNWGNYVVIDHGNNICTRYAHMIDGSITVNKGQQICQGLKIGEIGKSGNVTGYHLHFQFENCDNLGYSINFGFDDGNGKPACVIKEDVFTNGTYTALKLSNVERNSCGWSKSECGKLEGCPLALNCNNKGTPNFPDMGSMDSSTAAAASYLWRECAISGKSDGKFQPGAKLTRAEALKIALQTFGLTGNCKASEPFLDVDPWDWFYPYVLCGVKHGIISTIYSGFSPNGNVSFAEAAKIAVEAASTAGKIEIKFPDVVHFQGMNKEHWAFGYLETVYHYGGINTALLGRGPNDGVSRGEYAIMAASLSPCFCSSVKCDKGCACNQENYSCETSTVQTGADPGGQVAGSSGVDAGSSGQSMDAWTEGQSTDDESDGSGSGQSDDQDAVSSTSACTPYCYNKQCGIDGCGGNCGTCPGGYYCGDKNLCWPICYTVSCELGGYECGTFPQTGPGCEGITTLCGSCSAGKSCVNGKCVCVPSCYGKQCGGDGCGGTCGYCGSGTFCDVGQCKADFKSWSCDPAKGYSLKAASPGGNWVLPNSSGSGGPTFKVPISGEFNSTSPSYHADCKELPSVFIIEGGPGGVKLLVEDKTLPPVEVWLNYTGLYDPGPTSAPTLKAYELDLPAYTNLFVKIPASFCTPSCYGKQCGSDGCGGSCGFCGSGTNCLDGQCKADPCYNCPSGQCVNGQCKPVENGWKCDPPKGYVLKVHSPGGNWEAVTSPNQTHYTGVLPVDSKYKLTYSCTELPSYMLIQAGNQGGTVWLDDTSQPAFDIWYNYDGPLTFTPYWAPTLSTKYSYLAPNSKVLLRIPDK